MTLWFRWMELKTVLDLYYLLKKVLLICLKVTHMGRKNGLNYYQIIKYHLFLVKKEIYERLEENGNRIAKSAHCRTIKNLTAKLPRLVVEDKDSFRSDNSDTSKLTV